MGWSAAIIIIATIILIMGAIFKKWSWKFFATFIGIIIGLIIIFLTIYLYTTWQARLRDAEKKPTLKSVQEAIRHCQEEFKKQQIDHFQFEYAQSTTHGQMGSDPSTIITLFGAAAIQRKHFVLSVNATNPHLGVSIMPYYHPNEKPALKEIREYLATHPESRDKRTTKVIDEATGRTVEKIEELTPITTKQKEEEEGEI